MRDTEKELWEEIGFRLIDDYERQHVTYWGVLSGHDDERLDRPVQYGEWPQESQVIIQRLWHESVKLRERNAQRRASHRKLRTRLGATLVGTFVVCLVSSFFVSADRSEQFFSAWMYLGCFLIGIEVGTDLVE